MNYTTGDYSNVLRFLDALTKLVWEQPKGTSLSISLEKAIEFFLTNKKTQ
jgi:hypothetical protein